MARRGLILAALALLPVPSRAQTRQRRELARIQSELRRTLDELESLRGQESALGADVTRLEGMDESSRRRLETLQRSIREAEARRAGLKSRLDATGRVEGFWTAALSAETARLAAAEAGRSDFHGSGELWAERFRRDAILEKARHVRGLRGFQRRTEKAEADARRRAGELAESRRRAQSEREGRRREYEAKKAQLEQTQLRVAAAARRAKELEESAKALTALIDRLGRAAKYKRPAGAASLDRPRHSLPWPAAGKVVSSFGREKDPELGTWTVRQGLTLAAGAGAQVSAVAAGKVIFAGPFRSYGRVVIVDHGGGFFTVYGGMGGISREKGAEVRAGEALGGAGADGRLYFEVRRGAEALDPESWLQKR